MILLTGATGLLGSAIRQNLDRNDIPYVCTSRDAVDLTDFNSTLAFFKEHRPTSVVHSAARVHGLMGNSRFPAEIFDENLTINYNVIAAGYRTGVRKFNVASTVAAYPGELTENIHEGQYLMGEPHAGESAYAHSKRAMLAQLEAYAKQYGISYSYAIFTNLYGPGDRFDTENGHVVPSLVAKFHHAARSGTAVPVWGRGRAQRDFIYIDDAAAAMLHVAEAGEGRFNIATGTTVPIAEVVQILSDVSGVRDIQWQHEKPEGQLTRSYDVSRLRATGFAPRFSLHEGLERTYRWYEQNWPDVRT